jgi:hypothetical protein
VIDSTMSSNKTILGSFGGGLDVNEKVKIRLVDLISLESSILVGHIK